MNDPSESRYAAQIRRVVDFFEALRKTEDDPDFRFTVRANRELLVEALRSDEIGDPLKRRIRGLLEAAYVKY